MVKRFICKGDCPPQMGKWCGSKCPELLLEEVPLKLTEKEIQYIGETSYGLELIADYHDTQIVMAEAIGLSTEFHENRKKELLTKAEKMDS